MTGEQLKAARLAAGMTQEQLGERLGYSGANARTAVNRLEKDRLKNGISKGMEARLKAIFPALGVEM